MTEDPTFVSKLTGKEVEELQRLLSEHKREVLTRLEMLESVENLQPLRQLQVIGWLVDYGGDLQDEFSISKGIELGESIDESEVSSQHRGMLHYRIGTAYSNLSSVVMDDKTQWSWELPNVEEAMKHFRRAIREDDFEDLPELEQWRCLTNLGNLYSTVGRFVEAFDYWNEALIRQPYWFPARRQRGLGFVYYANHDYDDGHKTILLKKAYDELDFAGMDRFIGVSPNPTVNRFLRLKHQVSTQFDSPPPSDDILDLDDYDLGDTEEERRYRRWALSHRLFLNTLNDVTHGSVAASDILHLGKIRGARSERIVSCLGLWNQLVEEYVTARHLLYEGLNPDSGHYADNEVQHMNTLDYPIHSIYGEKLKIALRTAYSIFDKIGQFINYYFECGRDVENLSFSDIWYTEQHGNELSEKFQRRKNLPLRGLYWLSKDFNEEELHIEGSLDNSGHKLTNLRNALEHRYVKLTMFSVRDSTDTGRFNDELAVTMTRDELEDQALAMLRKVRAGLIYLALAVNREEELKPVSEEPSMPLYFGPLNPGPQ